MAGSEAADISPSEVFKELLESVVTAARIPGGVVVGPATDAQQQLGVISVVSAGLPRIERYLPLVWVRCQMRCIAGSEAKADQIAWDVFVNAGKVNRTAVTQPSTGDSYLVHNVNIIAGPSMHYDSPETWECLLFAEAQMGLQPIP